MNVLRRTAGEMWAGLGSGLRVIRDLLLWGRIYPELTPALAAKITAGRGRAKPPA